MSALLENNKSGVNNRNHAAMAVEFMLCLKKDDEIMNRLFVHICLFLNRVFTKNAVYFLLATLSSITPLSSFAQIQVRLEVITFYTNDVESFDEEWTFEIMVNEKNYNRFGTSIGGSNPGNATIITHTGDSNPNFLGARILNDSDRHTVFSKTYPTSESLPSALRVRQHAWENDRGARTSFDCCSFWQNDDDDYGIGSIIIYINELKDGIYYVGSVSFAGLKHGSSYILYITKADVQNTVK